MNIFAKKLSKNIVSRQFFSLLVVSLMTACGNSPQEDAKILALQTNPDIQVIGTFDGCEVKYVNRYYQNNSFYLARCDNTSTSTQHVRVQTGKTYRTDTHTAITAQLAEISKQKEQLLTEEKALKVRQTALEKLTPEERAALNISADDKK